MLKLPINVPIQTIGDQYKILDRVLKGIPKAILFGDSKQELCFNALNQFDFIPPLTNTVTDLERGTGIVLELLGLDAVFFKDKSEITDSLSRFMYYFLELKDLPGYHLSLLKSKVEQDLLTINRLIERYEELSFIQEGTTPRNQTENTQKEFYERCIEEQKKIRNHLRYGLKKRALVKAGAYTNIWGLGAWSDEQFDRPYILPWFQAEKYFDYEKIDTVTHRLLPLPIRAVRGLKTVYARDKAEFYRQLEAYRPLKTVLLQVKASAEFLPFTSAQRKEIFAELVGLYNEERYFGFYALALTQIEGLFTDMCGLCVAGMETKSLPKKVEALKRYSGMGISRLDYFNHHLPHLRNRFLHHGTDHTDSIENLCKDLIYDLEEVLTIFNRLEIDAIKLLKILRKPRLVDFNSLSDISTYIKLVVSLEKKGQSHYFGSEIESFNRTFIPHIFENLSEDIEREYESSMQQITSVIDILLKTNRKDFKTLEIRDIVSLKGVKKKLASNFYGHLKSSIQDIFKVSYFFSTWKDVLDIDSIDPSVVSKTEEFGKPVIPAVKKLRMLIKHSGAKEADFIFK